MRKATTMLAAAGLIWDERKLRVSLLLRGRGARSATSRGDRDDFVGARGGRERKEDPSLKASSKPDDRAEGEKKSRSHGGFRPFFSRRCLGHSFPPFSLLSHRPHPLSVSLSKKKKNPRNSRHSKKKAVHKASAGDDKRLQSTLKRLGVHQIPGIDEVAIYHDDGSVVHFGAPKVQASINANTFVVSGPSSVKSADEMIPAGLQGMSPEQLQALIRQMQAAQAGSGGGAAAAAAAAALEAGGAGGDDDEDIPELVENAE